MQSFSILPSKVQFLTGPQLDFELGTSSCVFRTDKCSKRRINKLGFGGALCGSRGTGVLLLSRKSVPVKVGICWRGSGVLGCGGFTGGYSSTKGFFRPSVGLRWATEEQVVEHEYVEEGSSAINGLFEDEDVRKPGVDNDGIGDDNEAEDKEVEVAESRGEDGDGERARMDVRALADSLKLAKTADDVEDSLKGRSDLPLEVCSTIIRAFGKEKNLDAAIALVQWLKKKKDETNGLLGPNIFIYNSLLGAIKHSGKFEESEKVLADMTEQGIVPNIVTYNTLMVIYVEQGRPTEALKLFSDIQNNGLSLAPATYSTAIMAYRRMEDGNGALNIFVSFREKYQNGEIEKAADKDWELEFVKIKNFTIRTCYQVMRQWLIRKENMSTNVLKLIMEMDKLGLTLSRADHERLVWACTREEHYIVARELYKRIRERHSGISLSVCNHVIWLLGKAKKWWAALEIYEDLLDKGPHPNNMSYQLIMSHFNILLAAARKRGIWRWGVRLLNKMEEKGLKPESMQWDAVLVACSKAAETSAAVQIFRRMVEKGEKPSVVSYGALLSALEKGKLYDEARRVWEHMLKVGVEPNLYAYTTMASVFTAQGKFNLVDAIIRDMISSGVTPTVVTYNAIISACAYNGMSSAAYEWFHRMKVQNIVPNEITYEMLIEALARDGKPRLAYELYRRAQNEELNLSSKAYDAVILSSEDHGATIDTSLLGQRPSDRAKKLKIRKSLTEFCRLADVPRRSKPFDRDEIYSIYD